MRDEELDKLVASVTPERLRELASTAWVTTRIRGRTAVAIMELVDGLMEGLDLSDGIERAHVIIRLHEAIVAIARQMPGAIVLTGS